MQSRDSGVLEHAAVCLAPMPAALCLGTLLCSSTGLLPIWSHSSADKHVSLSSPALLELVMTWANLHVWSMDGVYSMSAACGCQGGCLPLTAQDQAVCKWYTLDEE